MRDLEAAGIGVIQVDEPALRELLPLRRAGQDRYLAWAVDAYRRATAGAGDGTQIHTHLCYSDADQILAAIDALDADVTTIESARSGARILDEPAVGRFGPGARAGRVRHPLAAGTVGRRDRGPAVPGAADTAGHRVWVNPDCGLKTRTYPQVEAALAGLVEAARRVRVHSGRLSYPS